MKKGLLVAVCGIGLMFWGVTAASAGSVTWTLVETEDMALHSPGNDELLGTPDDGTSDKCNYSNAEECTTNGNPTTGAYSYTKLTFVQDMSCALGTQGASCTENADCGGPLTPCAPCNLPSKVGLGYFAKNPSAGNNRGLGTMTTSACDNGFSFSAMSVGTSEIVGSDGGGCLTLDSDVSSSGCGVGSIGTTTDMKIWVSTIPGCGFPAGTMPGIDLTGQIMAGPTGSAVCGYNSGEVTSIMTDAGIGSGSYLMIVCGDGTLPTDLEAACLPGADWYAILVAKTSTDIVTSCGDACSSGCMAGTAEGVE
jgi:hypothetical protein